MRFRDVVAPALSVVASGSLAAAHTAVAATRPTRPSPAEIRRAVRAAEHSPSLWATINVCGPPRHRHELGIRGQMPALRFRTDMYMTFQVEYRPPGQRRFRPDPGVRKRVFVGRAARSLRQAGVTLVFRQPAVLAGRVTFTWRLGGRTIGHITRPTTGHHRHVDYGNPRGHSAAICRLG